MAINFRRARPDDLHAIVAIFNESVDLPINDEVELVTPASRREWLAAFNDDFPLWVAEQDKRVVAWCGLEPSIRTPPTVLLPRFLSMSVDLLRARDWPPLPESG
ncbi:MAG: N-acetyltransferase family protein [Limosilactobacillus pontis]